MPPLDPNVSPQPFYTWTSTYTDSHYGSNAFTEAVRARQRQAQAEQQRALERQMEMARQQQEAFERVRMDPTQWMEDQLIPPMPVPTVEEIRARAQVHMGDQQQAPGFDTFTFQGATVHPTGLGDAVARIRTTAKDRDPIINPLEPVARMPF